MNLPSSFGGQLVVFAMCCGLAVLAWPIIKGAFPDSFPAENHGAEPFDEYGYKGDPGRFDRWKNAGQGGQREFSPYFPGQRNGEGR